MEMLLLGSRAVSVSSDVFVFWGQPRSGRQSFANTDFMQHGMQQQGGGGAGAMNMFVGAHGMGDMHKFQVRRGVLDGGQIAV